MRILGREGDFLLLIGIDDKNGRGITGIDVLIEDGGPASPATYATQVSGVVMHKIAVREGESRNISVHVPGTSLHWEKTINYSDEFE